MSEKLQSSRTEVTDTAPDVPDTPEVHERVPEELTRKMGEAALRGLEANSEPDPSMQYGMTAEGVGDLRRFGKRYDAMEVRQYPGFFRKYMKDRFRRNRNFLSQKNSPLRGLFLFPVLFPNSTHNVN